MRPQTMGLIFASTVTALFMAAVGLVALWDYLPARQPRPMQPQPQPFVFQVNPGAPVAPMPPQPGIEFDFPAPDLRPKPIAAEELPKVRGLVTPVEKLTLSGPHTHANLTIFLVRGQDTLKDQNILTLQEGLEQGLAVVHDRGRLLIDNRADAPLFIQAGDIVKGGSQDRTLPFDMLVSARTNQLPIAAFCVESGRSVPRANELGTSFQSSTEQLPGRKFRLATISGPDIAQGQVWSNVAALQANLARNVGGSVQVPRQETSLQLTLEHPRVQDAVRKYVADLGQIVDNKDDAIGYVVVVNGKIQSADVYASSSLFQKLWPKLLKAGAVEALAERQPGAAANAPSAETVQAFLAAAEKGSTSRLQTNRGLVIRHDTPQHLLFDTCDSARENLVLHRSYLAK